MAARGTKSFWRYLLPSRLPTIREAARYSARSLQLIGALYVLEDWVVDVRLTSGASMLPTLSHKPTLILTLKYPPALRPPNLKLGDLVVAQKPTDPQMYVCKRVLGLPGDTVCVDPIGAVRGHKGWEDGGGGREHVVVPRGHVWLAGDNMSASVDSRIFGPVSFALIKAKVIYRLWPEPGPLKNNLRELDVDEDV